MPGRIFVMRRLLSLIYVARGQSHALFTARRVPGGANVKISDYRRQPAGLADTLGSRNQV